MYTKQNFEEFARILANRMPSENDDPFIAYYKILTDITEVFGISNSKFDPQKFIATVIERAEKDKVEDLKKRILSL